MKALILLGTLKKNGLSNTETLCEYFIPFLQRHDVECFIVKLVDYNVLPGTYSNMGNNDEWPKILDRIEDSDIIIFASPIWWNNISSEIQRVIERLDEIHDEILSGKESRFSKKIGGIIITGDSDGSQSLLSSISNFFNFIGITLPPFAALTVLTENQAKDKNPSKEELFDIYEKSYTETAQKMADQMVRYSTALKNI